MGKIDKITMLIVTSRARAAQDVISGELDYMCDAPPPDLKPEVKARRKFARRSTTASTSRRWRLFAGELAPGCSFLPPGVPGYDRALDLEDCPRGDPTEPPDLEKARQLIADAGAEGADVTVWGSTLEPDPQLTQAYADMLNKMGLDAKPTIVDGAVYGQTVGNAKTKAHTGVTNWFQDVPHPGNFMSRVDGNSIQPTNSPNVGNVDDPEITSGIAELRQETELTGEVADRWGELNRQLVEEAWIAPYGHFKVSTFVSERMDFENCTLLHPAYYNDYSSFCLK
jgi:peptide/nickel transport system substrate-binding protein